MRGMMRNLPKLKHVMVPVLVLGGQRDGTVTIEELHSTARAYRTTAEVLPNMGHDMMLEPGWATVAERIHNWLTASGL
jgi:alpha-beta hydrolase superfamily lysophospholipase